jgi:hypothetical protein
LRAVEPVDADSPGLTISIASICLCLSLAAPAYAQTADAVLEIYGGCGMEGNARGPAVRAWNRLKNRCVASKPEQIAFGDARPYVPGFRQEVGRYPIHRDERRNVCVKYAITSKGVCCGL